MIAGSEVTEFFVFLYSFLHKIIGCFVETQIKCLLLILIYNMLINNCVQIYFLCFVRIAGDRRYEKAVYGKVLFFFLGNLSFFLLNNYLCLFFRTL